MNVCVYLRVRVREYLCVLAESVGQCNRRAFLEVTHVKGLGEPQDAQRSCPTSFYTQTLTHTETHTQWHSVPMVTVFQSGIFQAASGTVDTPQFVLEVCFDLSG